MNILNAESRAKALGKSNSKDKTAGLDLEPVRHGVECKKEPHIGKGYLHDEDDDSPYYVDALCYCGRCHEWIGRKTD